MLRIKLTQEQAAKLYNTAGFDVFMAEAGHEYFLDLLFPGSCCSAAEASSEHFHGIQGNTAIFIQPNDTVVWMRFDAAILEKVTVDV